MKILSLLVPLWATVMVSRPLQSQERTERRPTRVPVTLVMADASVPAGFQIVRRANESPHDVIVLGANSDRQTLSAAIHDLLIIRGQSGDTATVTGTVRVSRSTRVPGRELPWADRVLNDLRKAERRSVVGFGALRAVEVWLPPQRPSADRH